MARKKRTHAKGWAAILAVLVACSLFFGIAVSNDEHNASSETTEEEVAVAEPDANVNASADNEDDANTTHINLAPASANPESETGRGSTTQDETATTTDEDTSQRQDMQPNPVSLDDIPSYDDDAYVVIDDNDPDFSKSDQKTAAGTEEYGDFDELGRCTAAFAVVGPETQPTEERGSIGSVKPTGWHTVKYDCIDGKYLYNRCHLLGYQLTGENANPQNLITGTRYLNVEGMLPFEDAVDDYVEDTGNHVLMRVTPVFKDDELVARGVHMEAESLEDDGYGVCFNVYCYNVQPGVKINYATGASKQTGKARSDSTSSTKASESSSTSEEHDYVLNTNTHKFHTPSCSSVESMKQRNRKEVTDTRENVIERGYEPCKRCNP